jgi:predicted dehydrogenase
MARKKFGVGVVGCGATSSIYLKNLPKFDNLRVVACADIDMQRARARAQEFAVPHVCTVDELLERKDVDLVLNITIPAAHGDIALRAVRAGKSVYNEKPLAIDRSQARKAMREADRLDLQMGGAPDTFLGSALQTCRRLLDEGAIGEPVGVAGAILCRGHESWHPSPEFYYQPGGGPLFDVGPYYLTAMVSLLGPVRQVSGSARASFKQRTITSSPLAGQKIQVRVPTHVAGTMEFASGPIGTMAASFDVWASDGAQLQLFGSEGSLLIPDPNNFGGEVRLWRHDARKWVVNKATHPYSDNWRGVGVADLARAIATGRPPRAGADLAYHVLDLMQGFHDAAAKGAGVTLRSRCARPEPMNPAMPEGRLD